MQQFLTILSFYRPFVVWSFIVNISIAIVFPFIVPAIITKLLLTVFVWHIAHETHTRRKLNFYKRLGISPLKLFASLFVFDLMITLAFLMLVKEFI